MPYGSLTTRRYYRVKDHDVLWLAARHEQNGCTFTQHEDDPSVITIPNFDDVEREATIPEITGHLLRVHAPSLAQVEQINRALVENSARIRSGELDARQCDELRNENIRLSKELSRQLQPVIRDIFRAPTDYDGLRYLMGKFLQGELPGTPWVSGSLMLESSTIARHLQIMTKLGFITYESQPSGQSHQIPEVPDVREHQNAYLEISGPQNLMAALQDGIIEANRTLARKIFVVKPWQETSATLRTLVGSSAPQIRKVRIDATITEEHDHYVARIATSVSNNNRYQQLLYRVNPALAQAMRGHVTLFLVSSTYRDEDSTVFFDDLINLMRGAVTRVEREQALDAREPTAEEELTAEEAHVGHLAELK
jgi:hypothetical protein